MTDDEYHSKPIILTGNEEFIRKEDLPFEHPGIKALVRALNIVDDKIKSGELIVGADGYLKESEKHLQELYQSKATDL
jgi:hypothetical protein